MARTLRIAPPLLIAAVAVGLAVGPAACGPRAGTGGAKADSTTAAAPPPIVPPVMSTPTGSAQVEQIAQGAKPPATIAVSFDGLGAGFQGPQGDFHRRNPSDNSLAVGPDHIVQIVNTRVAIFTKRGSASIPPGRFCMDRLRRTMSSRGSAATCEAQNSGDAVVRYDQLADRWLIVMPIFRVEATRPDAPAPWKAGGPASVSPRGRPNQPGPAVQMYQPPAPLAADSAEDPARRGPRPPEVPQGLHSMCYAVSSSPDPLGTYYRYEFLRPFFPDYPRPAVWPDGYYLPTSTSDHRISPTVATQKHACVAERAKMLKRTARDRAVYPDREREFPQQCRCRG